MDKQFVTEDMHLEKEWFEEARNIKTIDELSRFVDKLMNSYYHDYGTACHAIAACAIACAEFGAAHEGITGFQASFVMWDFIYHWTKRGNKCGLRLIDYDKFLFPQYEREFDKIISRETWESIQKEAENLLGDTDKFACDKVEQHWKNIVNGKVPFGYKVVEEIF